MDRVQLRLVPTDPPPVLDVEDAVADLDDGTLGGLFASLHAEAARLSSHPAAPAVFGGLVLHLAALAEDYIGVPMPPPVERT